MSVAGAERLLPAGPLLALALPGLAEAKHARPATKDPVQDKSFYLLSAPAVCNPVKSSAPLAEIAAAKRAALSEAVKSCAADISCYVNAVVWTDDEITRTGTAPGALAADTSIRQLIAGPVIRSGMYQRHSQGTLAALLFGLELKPLANSLNTDPADPMDL